MKKRIAGLFIALVLLPMAALVNAQTEPKLLYDSGVTDNGVYGFMFDQVTAPAAVSTDLRAKTPSIYDYGFSDGHWYNADGTSRIGSSARPVKLSTNTNTLGRILGKQRFVNDIVNNPPAFNSEAEIYTYEMEFGIKNATTAKKVYFRFMGNNGAGDKEIATLEFTGASNTFITKSGSKVSGTDKAFSWTADTNRPTSVGYIKFNFDLKNKTFTAWLVHRGVQASYVKTAATDSHLIIKDCPFDSDIIEFSGVDFIMDHNGTTTNGIWFSYIEVSQISAADIIEDAKSALTPNIIKKDNSALDNILTDLNLPKSLNGTDIEWSAVPEGVIDTDTGVVMRPVDSDKEVSLTASISRGNVIETKAFSLNVKVFAENGSIDITEAEFDSFIHASNYRDIAVRLNKGGYSFIKLRNETTGLDLTEGTDYTVYEDVYTIKKEYLKALTGNQIIRFVMNNGYQPEILIRCENSYAITGSFTPLTGIVENVDDKTLILKKGDEISDIINIRDVRDNFLYKIAPDASDYSKIAHASTKESAGAKETAINTVNFFKAFDGFQSTVGTTNIYVNGTTVRTPSVIAFDLGEEKYFNNILVDTINSEYKEKSMDTWGIKISNDPAKFEEIHNSDSKGGAAVNSDTSWNRIYYTTTDKIGNNGGTEKAVVDFNKLVKARYVMLNIEKLTASSSLNVAFANLAIYLRDIESDEYKLDYGNKTVEIDSSVQADNLLSSIKSKDLYLEYGVFEDFEGINAVSGSTLAAGKYLVTYFIDDLGEKDIVSVYEIKETMPEVRNVIISTNGVDVGNTLSLTYEFVEKSGFISENDESIIQWFRDGTKIPNANNVNYIVTTKDAGKNITAEVTPKCGGVTGNTVTNQEQSATVKKVMGGNVMENVTEITTTVKTNGALEVDKKGWNENNAREMLSGKLVETTYAKGSGTTSGELTFKVTLKQARYINTMVLSPYGVWKNYTVKGYLNGTQTAVLVPETSGTPAGNTIRGCEPVLVDQIELVIGLDSAQYTNGIVRFEAYCDVSDEEAVILDQQVLQKLPAFSNINGDIDFSAYTKGVMYSDITWDSGESGYIDKNGRLLFDGIYATGTFYVTCSRGDFTGDTVEVPFTILNDRIIEFTEFEVRADGEVVENLLELEGVSKDALITLNGNVKRQNDHHQYPVSVIVAAYSDGNRLEALITNYVSKTNPDYELNCKSLLKGKNIKKIKVFAIDYETMLPFKVLNKEGEGINPHSSFINPEQSFR